MIKGISHVAFNVSQMEKSMEFYCDVLGFKKAFELKDDEGKPWINYLRVSEDQFIELFYIEPEKCTKPSYSHLCLEVEDIHEIAERIKSKGISLDIEPVQGKDLNYQCWVRDPDGNRIELMQLHPDSPQKKSK